MMEQKASSSDTNQEGVPSLPSVSMKNNNNIIADGEAVSKEPGGNGVGICQETPDSTGRNLQQGFSKTNTDVTVGRSNVAKCVDDVSKSVDDVSKSVDDVSKIVGSVTKNVDDVTKLVDDVIEGAADLNKCVNDVTRKVDDHTKSVYDDTKSGDDVNKSDASFSKIGTYDDKTSTIVNKLITDTIKDGADVAKSNSDGTKSVANVAKTDADGCKNTMNPTKGGIDSPAKAIVDVVIAEQSTNSNGVSINDICNEKLSDSSEAFKQESGNRDLTAASPDNRRVVEKKMHAKVSGSVISGDSSNSSKLCKENLEAGDCSIAERKDVSDDGTSAQEVRKSAGVGLKSVDEDVDSEKSSKEVEGQTVNIGAEESSSNAEGQKVNAGDEESSNKVEGQKLNPSDIPSSNGKSDNHHGDEIAADTVEGQKVTITENSMSDGKPDDKVGDEIAADTVKGDSAGEVNGDHDKTTTNSGGEGSDGLNKNADGTFHCTYCTNSFESNADRIKHEQGHKPPKSPSYKCDICKQKFSRSALLKQHRESHFGEKSPKKFKCDLCEKEYGRKDHLWRHCKKVHYGYKKCQFCDRIFENQSLLEAHEVTHDGKFPHQCDQCGRHFSNSWNLGRHQQTHSQQFLCTHCDILFNESDELKQHKIMEHGGMDTSPCKESPGRTSTRHVGNTSQSGQAGNTPPTKQTGNTSKCRYCGIVFPTTAKLREHETSHTRGKTFACLYCGATFSQKGTLQLHEVEKHMNFDEKMPVGITKGSAPAPTKTSESNKEVLSFKCRYCSQHFATLSQMRRHEITHTRGKTYECEYCSATFSQKGTLKLHEMEKHMDEDFQSNVKRVKLSSPKAPGPKAPSTAVEKGMDAKLTPNGKQSKLSSPKAPGRNDSSSEQEGWERESRPKRTKLSSPKSSSTKILSSELGDVEAERYYCEKCDDSFSNEVDLETHLDTHPTCQACGKKFANDRGLQTHIRLYHSGNDMECPTCGKVFEHEAQLKRHLVFHESNRPFKCDKCDGTYKNKWALQQHQVLHSSQVFKCSKCGKVFKRLDSLERHQKLSYCKAKQQQGFKCQQCKETYRCQVTFDNEEDLAQHTAKHHGKVHKCPMCKQTFVEEESLIKHEANKSFCVQYLASQVPRREEMYSCKECEERFEDIISLGVHTCQRAKRVSGDKSKGQSLKFTCELCGLTFDTRVLFTQHQELHKISSSTTTQGEPGMGDKNIASAGCSREKPATFTCGYCISTFTTKDSLKEHLKNCVPDDSELSDEDIWYDMRSRRKQAKKTPSDDRVGFSISSRYRKQTSTGSHIVIKERPSEAKDVSPITPKQTKTRTGQAVSTPARSEASSVSPRETKTRTGRTVVTPVRFRQGEFMEDSLESDEGDLEKENEEMSGEDDEDMRSDGDDNNRSGEMSNEDELSGSDDEDEVMEEEDEQSLSEEASDNGSRNDSKGKSFSSKNRNLRFSRKSSLKQHKAGKKKKFACSRCPASYDDEKKMIDHERKHEGIYYQCKECLKAFGWRCSVKRHIKKMHYKKGMAEEADVSDDEYCDVVLPIKDKMKTHKGRKHCTASFKLENHLMEHKNLHKGGCYYCKECLKTFRGSDSLNRHMKLIHAKKKRGRPFKTQSLRYRGASTLGARGRDSRSLRPRRDAARLKETQKAFDEASISKTSKSTASVKEIQKKIGEAPKSKISESTTVDNKKEQVSLRPRRGAGDVEEMPKEVTDAPKSQTSESQEEDGKKEQASHRSHGGAGDVKGTQKEVGEALKSQASESATKDDENEYKCKLCSLVFSGQKRLQSHQEVHNRNEKYKCRQCSASFKDTSHRHYHELRHKGEVYRCNECPSTFQWGHNLHRHVRQFHGDKLRSQPNGDESEKSSISNDKERTLATAGVNNTNASNKKETSATSDNVSVKSLNVCSGKETSGPSDSASVKNLNSVNRKRTSGDSTSMQSSNCSNKRKILASGDRANEQVHKCKICSLGFRTEGHMKKHQAVHKRNEKYKCGQCSASFSNDRYRADHERRHSGQVHQCEICSGTFAWETGLRRHLRDMHQIDPRTQGKQLSSKGDKDGKDDENERVKSSNSSSGKGTLATSVVAKLKNPNARNKQRTSLRRQTQDAQEEDEDSYDDGESSSVKSSNSSNGKRNLITGDDASGKPFKCKHCSLEFRGKKHFKNHQDVHTRNEKYKCSQCSASFSAERLRSDHERRHRGEMHTCQICSRTYTLGTSLHRHMQEKHEDDLQTQAKQTKSKRDQNDDSNVTSSNSSIGKRTLAAGDSANEKKSKSVHEEGTLSTDESAIEKVSKSSHEEGTLSTGDSDIAD